VGEEHRNLGAVLARVEHLLDLEVVGVERDLRGPPDGELARAGVEAVHGAGHRETRKRQERLVVLGLAANAPDAADSGQGHVVRELARGLEHLQLGMCVRQVRGDEATVDQLDLGQGVLGLPDDLLGLIGLAQIDLDQA